MNQLPTRIFFLVRRLYLNFQEPLQPKEKQAFFNSYKDKEKLIGRQICLPKYSLLINEPGRELILSGLIAKSLDHRKFDYILIDCPPSLGLLTLNALTAADYLIIPVQAQFLAMRGMAKIMNVIATVQERLNPKLAIGGIVITQFDKRKTLNKSVAELVKDSFCDKVFKTVIRDNVSLAEAPIKGKNIFEYSKNSNGAKDYMALAQEVLKLK